MQVTSTECVRSRCDSQPSCGNNTSEPATMMAPRMPMSDLAV